MEEAAAIVAAPDSTHSQRIRPRGPVRVVARICPGGTGPGGGSFQVAARVVSDADSSAVVSLLPLHEDSTPRPGAPPTRKDYDYRLDGYYPKDDESCRQIFDGEVKPLVDAIFRGTNSCVVACGATAKTNLIMAQPAGLLTMAMEQILLLSHPIAAAVSVSSYQVLQDNHVFDLLEPKDSEVLVLEGADGRTNLKGLSRLRVKSIQEFADLCCCGTNMLEHPSKPSSHSQPKGGHRGFIVYISKLDQEGKECILAKMDFLILAGYVDPKQRNNGGGLALPNCNKSMHTLMNVVQSLNSNQSFIPYRQSKITRIIQDSLCKTNSAVLIACMDEFSSQDAVSTLSLASRSSQVVNDQCYSLSLGSRSSSKSNVNHSASAKNLSRSLLDKHNRTQFNKSAVKASQTPAANQRSKATCSSKKSASALSAYANQRSIKPALSGRKLFCQGTNKPKEDKIVAAPIGVTKAEELQSSLGMEIQAPLPAEGFNEAEKVIELAPCNMQELVSSSIQDEDSSSDLHADHSCTNLENMCLSDVADDTVEKIPDDATESSPNLTDRLREISNTLKRLNTRPLSVMKQKSDMVGVQDFSADLTEPKTPAIQLKFGHAEDSHECSTGIQKSLAIRECLKFLNSANKDQLKSLKGIGEKRANYILERREEAPELFKEVDDLKTIIGMNKKEIKSLMTGMIMDL